MQKSTRLKQPVPDLFRQKSAKNAIPMLAKPNIPAKVSKKSQPLPTHHERSAKVDRKIMTFAETAHPIIPK